MRFRKAYSVTRPTWPNNGKQPVVGAKKKVWVSILCNSQLGKYEEGQPCGHKHPNRPLAKACGKRRADKLNKGVQRVMDQFRKKHPLEKGKFKCPRCGKVASMRTKEAPATGYRRKGTEYRHELPPMRMPGFGFCSVSESCWVDDDVLVFAKAVARDLMKEKKSGSGR